MKVASIEEVKSLAASEEAEQSRRKDFNRKLGKIPFLDGVRGLAVLLVVAHHAGYMTDGVNLGLCAVDIFFVLSSFLLTLLFYQKSERLMAEDASYRKWAYTLADYFSKRFFRVYPLFAIIAIVLWVLPYPYKKQFFLIAKPDHFDLVKVLTFELPYRYHVFWTLPLEIAYYFLIPVFVVVTLALGPAWWLLFGLMFIWIVDMGVHGFRTHHQPLSPHLPTFVAGSMAAVVYLKLDTAIKRNAVQLTPHQLLGLRVFEYAVFGLLLSACFKGLFFHWVHANPIRENFGTRFISLHVTSLIVIEMLFPSELSRMFEWNVFRYWGKISFSVYMLHCFAIYSSFVRYQPNYYDNLFGKFGLTLMLATASYHLQQSESNVVRRTRAVDDDKEDSMRSAQDLSLAVGDETREPSDAAQQNSASKSKSLKAKNQNSACSSGNGGEGRGPAKILFLDGVRGLAVIFVITEHVGWMGDVNLGNCAVDIFFVLSSFLLTMLFYKKSVQLLTQKASVRKWGYTLADYFSKRFFRVYPLFALVALLIWVLPYEYKQQYMLVRQRDHYDIIKVLTFEFPYRYHVFWTLPVEIGYYFLIPAFVLASIVLGRAWWVPFIPLHMWVINVGWNEFRGDHQPLANHLPTFVAGSMGAVIFVQLDAAIRRHAFEFSKYQTLAIRLTEYIIFGLLVSVCYRGLFFHWIRENPAPEDNGSRFISLHVTSLIVIEALLPSWISRMFEWNVLRYWGKVSFSVYMLHSFVIYSNPVRHMPYYYDKLFAIFGLSLLVSTASYHLVEYPSQLMVQRVSETLAQWEKAASMSPSEWARVAVADLECGIAAVEKAQHHASGSQSPFL
uniref:Acyltransferase 3 domain-containing protein n=1 Tax=Globisporangium ultimum (strain ATCC 200006 / CBS 805.95 / DAOM BR144) TaxID=431595 RepID=K3WMB2_GLOUD